MGDLLGSPRVASLLFVFLPFQLSRAFAVRRLIRLAVFVFPRPRDAARQSGAEPAQILLESLPTQELK